MRHVSIVLVTALLLSACAALWLTSDLPLLRVAPGSLGNHTASQRIALNYGGKTQLFDAVVESDAEQLTVIGLTFGVRLFGLSWDGHTLNVEKAPPGGLPGQRILNDVLLLVTPTQALQEALPANCSVQNAANVRTLSCDEQTLVRIETTGSVWNGQTTFTHLRLGYTFTLNSIEVVSP